MPEVFAALVFVCQGVSLHRQMKAYLFQVCCLIRNITSSKIYFRFELIQTLQANCNPTAESSGFERINGRKSIFCCIQFRCNSCESIFIYLFYWNWTTKLCAHSNWNCHAVYVGVKEVYWYFTIDLKYSYYSMAHTSADRDSHKWSFQWAANKHIHTHNAYCMLHARWVWVLCVRSSAQPIHEHIILLLMDIEHRPNIYWYFLSAHIL